MDFKIDPRALVSNATMPTTTRKQRDLQSLKESSQEFEAIFVMEMFKEMRKTIPEGGLFEKNIATEIYQEMMDMETARAVAKGPGLGIADAMYKQMAHLIEDKK